MEAGRRGAPEGWRRSLNLRTTAILASLWMASWTSGIGAETPLRYSAVGDDRQPTPASCPPTAMTTWRRS